MAIHTFLCQITFAEFYIHIYVKFLMPETLYKETFGITNSSA